MKISLLTFVAFNLNGAMDTGRYDDIFIDTVKKEIEKGTIFDFLRARLGEDIDLSILKSSDEMELVAEWQDLLFSVNERRKMSIERRGLNLLIAYLLVGIQRRHAERGA